ncbi:hypothetical protein AB685_14590 [Bacillus sp. LL01]|uniref:sensor histidine kinase n=1 Tax=Bacillus sp. LL01 TaxID=1665556 RepID=UPI00064D5578|nr:HAMP domain-containing sensor histidine kinase [Bacillus sp. LL01]KMJ58042.1 hypothetical protein AB685_14590 [Bacillus sp. LL01]
MPSEFFRQLGIFFYCAISAYFCSQFPIHINDVSFHLSGIPVMIAILYGGYFAGVLTILFLVAHSFISPLPEGYMHTYFIIPALVVLPLFFLKKCKSYSTVSKYKFMTIVAGIGGVLHIITATLLLFNNNVTAAWKDLFPQTLLIGMVFMGSSLLLLYLIEFLCGVVQLQQKFKKMKRLYHINIMAEKVSNEFHKPLTMVKGFTQLLGMEKNKVNKEYVPIILHELTSAERIIESYLKLAKGETISFRTISSKELLENVLTGIYTYAINQNVEIRSKNTRNLRIKGNMEMLEESMSNILKHCIDTNGRGFKKIQLSHYLHRNDAVFEIHLDTIRNDKEPIKTLLHLTALLDNNENSSLYTAYTILLAHGGDIQIKTRRFNKIVILTLPAQIKKSEYISRKVIRTN